VSPPGWPALRTAIDTGQARLVAAALEDLDEGQRRVLAAEVRAYARPLARDFEMDWQFRRHRILALRVAGAGCLPGPDTVARWLFRQDLRTWDEQDTTTEVLRVLRARQVPWLPELTRRLAARLRTDEWDHQRWRLIAELATSTELRDLEVPTSDGFVLGWGAGTADGRPARRHPGRRPLLRCPDPAPARGGRDRWAVRLVRVRVDGSGGQLAAGPGRPGRVRPAGAGPAA
jgi:hypothetical protein